MHFSMLKNDDVFSCFSLAYVSKQSGNKSGEMHETSWDVIYLQKQRPKERTLEVSDLTDVLRPNVHRSPVLLSVMNGAWSMPAISLLKGIGTHCSSAYSLKSKRGGFDLLMAKQCMAAWSRLCFWKHTSFVDVLNKRAYQGLLNSYRECCFCYCCSFFSVYIFNKKYQKVPILHSRMYSHWRVQNEGQPTALKGWCWKPAAWRHEFNPGIPGDSISVLSSRLRKKLPIILDLQGPMPWGGGGKEAWQSIHGKSLKKGKSPLSDGFFAVANKAQKQATKKAIKGAEVEQDVSGVKSMLDVLLTIILQFMKINRGMRSTVAIVGVSPNFMSFFWCEFAKGKKHFKSWQLFLA